MRIIKQIVFLFISLTILFLMLVMSIYLWVGKSSNTYIYSEVDDVPNHYAAVVLGTSRQTIYGTENLFFKYRMDAAAELYHSGKVQKLLVSGDNRRSEYNEPVDMRKALISRGVQKEDIVLDFAGFRTFDSMVRANKVFGQDSFLIVSQLFHLERAIFIARSKKIRVSGYAARDPKRRATRVYMREIPARFKAFLDCYILNTQPYFLGEQEEI